MSFEVQIRIYYHSNYTGDCIEKKLFATLFVLQDVRYGWDRFYRATMASFLVPNMFPYNFCGRKMSAF